MAKWKYNSWNRTKRQAESEIQYFKERNPKMKMKMTKDPNGRYTTWVWE